MHIFTPVFIVLSLVVSSGYAQDPVKVDPGHYRVEFENEQVRVLRITYGPGERSVMHEHPASVAVFLTDGTFQMTLPGGEVQQGVATMQGAANWAEASTHLPENVGNTAAELILIELKTPVR